MIFYRAYYDNDYACMILHTTADIQDRNGGRGLGGVCDGGVWVRMLKWTAIFFATLTFTLHIGSTPCM